MYTRILVAVDGSEASRRGLDEAIGLAARLGATLHLLNVVDARLLIGEVSAAVAPERLLDDWRAAGKALVAQGVQQAVARGVTAAHERLPCVGSAASAAAVPTMGHARP
jgi:nucleotide-binding universal stress UspA family protein